MGYEMVTLAIIGGIFFIAFVIFLIVKPKGQVVGTEAKPQKGSPFRPLQKMEPVTSSG